MLQLLLSTKSYKSTPTPKIQVTSLLRGGTHEVILSLIGSIRS